LIFLNLHIKLYMFKNPHKNKYATVGGFRRYASLTALIMFFTMYTPHLFAQGVVQDTFRVNSTTVKDTNDVSGNPGDTEAITQTDTLRIDSTNLHVDSTLALKAKPYKHSPLKAAVFSAVLPGLGQAYNKKYWKIPIIYAGFGGLGVAVYYTASNFQGFRTAYRAQVATVPNPNASYNGVSDAASLKEYRDYYKKYLDISCIGLGVWYMLTIVDATVDAHLFDWNMRDDLSISWQPVIMNTPGSFSNPLAGGLAFGLRF
jgi:hypothetical protein